MAALVAAEGLTKRRERSGDSHVDSRQQVAGGLRGRAGLAQRRQRDGVAGGLRANHADGGRTDVTVVNLLEATVGRQRVPELVDGDVVYVAKRMLRPSM